MNVQTAIKCENSSLADIMTMMDMIDDPYNAH